VNGTFVRNLEKPLLLFRLELSHEVNVALNSVDLAFLCFAVPTIRGVDLRMTKIHGHTFKRPLLRSRVHGHGHRRAGTERGKKQIVGRRAGIFPAGLDWFVCGQPMWTDNDLLGEPRRVAAYNYIRGSHARMLPSSRPAASRVAEIFDSYSVRNASIGFTRVARSAGTKHEAAATIVSNAATAV
jgi:hypothetical protein